jgi:myo-inositol-1(or 4)-monophosphatase
LVEYNQPTIGAFYMPDSDDLFYGLKGVGAYYNNQEISVTKENNISDSYISLSGKECGKIQPMVSQHLNSRYQKLGSALVSESWIASGWSDVGIYTALAPWDMAVGKVLVQAAGGVMKSVENRSEDWEDISNGKVVSGNEELVDNVLDSLPKETENAIINSTYDY